MRCYINNEPYEYNSINELKNIFDKIECDKIISLDLSSNRLTNLDKDMFSKLSNLQHLELYNNQLTDLDKNIFNELSNLQNLDLSHNQLTNLDKDTFNGVLNLQRLVLSYNQLTNLDKDMFSKLSNLQLLYLSKNLLIERPELNTDIKLSFDPQCKSLIKGNRKLLKK